MNFLLLLYLLPIIICSSARNPCETRSTDAFQSKFILDFTNNFNSALERPMFHIGQGTLEQGMETIRSLTTSRFIAQSRYEIGFNCSGAIAFDIGAGSQLVLYWHLPANVSEAMSYHTSYEVNINKSPGTLITLYNENFKKLATEWKKALEQTIKSPIYLTGLPNGYRIRLTFMEISRTLHLALSLNFQLKIDEGYYYQIRHVNSQKFLTADSATKISLTSAGSTTVSYQQWKFKSVSTWICLFNRNLGAVKLNRDTKTFYANGDGSWAAQFDIIWSPDGDFRFRTLNMTEAQNYYWNFNGIDSLTLEILPAKSELFELIRLDEKV